MQKDPSLIGNTDDGDPARDRSVSEAFRRAVTREHEAIALHELAADMHEASATQLEATAAIETDPEIAAQRRGGRTLSVPARR